VNLLNQITGDGHIALNHGETSYSQVGPMKMAPYVVKNIDAGCILKKSDFDFIRTSQISDITQVHSKSLTGKVLSNNIKKGQVLLMSDFL
jgi:sialic acid synthase SpsE